MRAIILRACTAITWVYLGAMTVLAADNPCVKNWQWQWKTTPTLGITGPGTLPDTCVGPHSIGPATVTATAGVKWEVDVNNCPEPPFTRNETSVPITPVNTWSLYLSPPGTTPASGSGTTAMFTTIQGGSVVVQFETRATVSIPAWDSGVLAWRTIPFRVVEVTAAAASEGTEIDDGDGNSNTKTFVVCKGAGNVTVTATPNPSMTEAELANTCWSTAGGMGTAKLTRTVSKAAAGPPTTVTFTAGSSSKSVTVIVVEVASAAPSEGTEIDDGDGNPNTKSYVVCKGSGNVTVTATANPSMTEAQLAGTCWTTAGGTGTAKLTRTVSKAAAGPPTTVTFTAGSSSKSVTITVVEVAGIGTDLGAETCVNGNVSTWVVCAGPGTITVTATANPTMTEAQLANSCWTTIGGTGTAKLTRTVNKSTPGTYTITCTAGISQKTAQVVVVGVTINLSSDRIPIYGGQSPIEGSATITLNPSALPCGNVTVTLSRTAGAAGSATFSDGTMSRAIPQSSTLAIRGAANSDVKNNMVVSACTVTAAFSVRTWPVNFRQTSASGANGVLYFSYVWDSEAGSASYLSGVTMGEIVTYPGPFSIPPYSASPANPTIIDLDATSGTFNDTHSSPGFQTPYSSNNISGTQYYRYKDTVYAPSTYNNVMGPISIDRLIYFESPTGQWKYRITKTGISSERVLP